jgi:3',5'-cyclic AMP phosphodiesterase CpdA
MLYSRRDALKAAALWSVSPALLAAEPAVRDAQSAAKAAPAPAKVPQKEAKDPYADGKLVAGEPPLPAEGSFTVAVLPDTQHYSERFPEQFVAQTDWIAANKEQRRIASVLHLGDITNRNTRAEWEVASRALAKLDDTLPYFLTLGNHDYSEGGTCKDRTSRFGEYFKLAKYRDLRSFGGAYGGEQAGLENSYHYFSAAGRDFVVISLEFGPRKEVVRWANEVAAKHRDREAILITHAYMYYDDTRYDWARYGAKQTWNPHSYAVAKASDGDVHDGEQLWQNLVSKNENFILTLNGHVLQDGLGRTVSKTPAGRSIPQVLVNFQMRPRGGDGWLRLLEFCADRSTVRVFDYSPTRKERNESPQNHFTMSLSAPRTA